MRFKPAKLEVKFKKLNISTLHLNNELTFVIKHLSLVIRVEGFPMCDKIVLQQFFDEGMGRRMQHHMLNVCYFLRAILEKWL